MVENGNDGFLKNFLDGLKSAEAEPTDQSALVTFRAWTCDLVAKEFRLSVENQNFFIDYHGTFHRGDDGRWSATVDGGAEAHLPPPEPSP